MRIYLTLFVFLSTILFNSSIIFAEPEIKGTPDELTRFLEKKEEITISANATIEIEAKEAVVILNVITEDSLFEKAIRNNKENISSIKNVLQKAGVASDRIITTKFLSTPLYGLIGKKPKSYQVVNLLQINIQKDDELLIIAKVVDNNENVFFQELKLDYQDLEILHNKILSNALDNLNEKVELYENKFNVKLTPNVFQDAIISLNNETLEPDMTQWKRKFSLDRSYSLDSSYSSSELAEKFPKVHGPIIIHAEISADYLLNTN